jgi:hypothetical protein
MTCPLDFRHTDSLVQVLLSGDPVHISVGESLVLGGVHCRKIMFYLTMRRFSGVR